MLWPWRIRMINKVNLVQIEGTTSIYIDAEITDKGDLLISGQDLGHATDHSFGGSEYEYWLRITEPNKDRVLLALIEKLYLGDSSLVSELKNYLDSKEIPCEFSNYF
jgi:hypothetical protein